MIAKVYVDKCKIDNPFKNDMINIHDLQTLKLIHLNVNRKHLLIDGF